MPRLRTLVCVIALTALLIAGGWLLPSGPGLRLVHTEPSSFSPVLVTAEAGLRCMTFASLTEPGRQTCIQVDNPDRMVFAYTRMMMAGLLLNPEPRSVLMIGLGGATLPRALAKLYPQATIDSIEIDPAVARVAEHHFGYTQGPRQRLFIQDGRHFVERAAAAGQQYDLILLDAFDADYIPPHLMTVEFFRELRQLLTDDGVFVANAFTRSKHYDRESATFAATFGAFFNLRDNLEGNRVIITAKNTLPGHDTLAQNAQALAASLQPFGIDLDQELARLVRIDTNTHKARPLTDHDHWK